MKRLSRLRLYHTLDIGAVRYGTMRADRAFSEPDDLPAYEWLERQIGFFPLFMAFGPKRVVGITGYCNQWRVKVGQDPKIAVPPYRRKGEFPNMAMLVFEPHAVDNGIIIDDDGWGACMNPAWNNEPVPAFSYTCMFRPTWSPARWVKRAQWADLQVLVPQLDMRKACEIWVRNIPSRRRLEAMGFDNVIVRRVPVPPKS